MTRAKMRAAERKPLLVGVAAGRNDYRPGVPPALPALTAGQVRCPQCLRGVLPRADGSLRAHQSPSGVSCIGATPTGVPSGLCEHGNYPYQRQACGCARRGDGRRKADVAIGAAEICPGCGHLSKVMADGKTLWAHKPCGRGQKVPA
jgi:hypothetical protein